MATSPPVRIHLSTAVVLVLAASTFLLMNFRASTVNPFSDTEYVGEPGSKTTRSLRGWPFTFVSHDRIVSVPDATRPEDIRVINRLAGFDGPVFVLDCVIGFLVLVALAALCEWRIRRRTESKP